MSFISPTTIGNNVPNTSHGTFNITGGNYTILNPSHSQPYDINVNGIMVYKTLMELQKKIEVLTTKVDHLSFLNSFATEKKLKAILVIQRAWRERMYGLGSKVFDEAKKNFESLCYA